MIEEAFGWAVHTHAPSAVRVLDTQDLHSLRSARHECITAGGSNADPLVTAPDVLGPASDLLL